MEQTFKKWNWFCFGCIKLMGLVDDIYHAEQSSWKPCHRCNHPGRRPTYHIAYPDKLQPVDDRIVDAAFL